MDSEYITLTKVSDFSVQPPLGEWLYPMFGSGYYAYFTTKEEALAELEKMIKLENEERIALFEKLKEENK